MIRKSVNTSLAGAFLVTTAICAPQVAAAQQEAAPFLEEIVVTATKRGAQALQNVPVTVQALTGDLISRVGAVEFTDVAGKIPGLAFQDQGPGDRKYVIRGVNSRGTATTGVYFGEAVITGRNKQDGGGRQADIELHDLQRIEVLKGPQGTLFGASSMSGTLRFIPNDPDPSAFAARAEVEAMTVRHGGEGFRANAMVNAPVAEDKAAIRAVAWITREDGWVDNVRLGLDDINDNEVTGGRLMTKFELTEGFSVTAMALYQKREVDGSSRINIDRLQPGFEANLNTFGFGALPVGELENQEFTINNWDEEMQLYSLVAEWDTGWGTFLATTNYFDREIEYRFDSTPILLFFGAPAAAVTFEPQSRDVWSNEIRFSSDFDGPLNFVVGGFLSREDKDFEVQVLATGADGLPLGPFDTSKDFFLDGPPNAAIFGRQKLDDLNQEALFGEVTFEATERLTFVAGIRYFTSDLTSDAIQTKPFVGFPPNNNTAFSVNQDDSKTTFKFNASYQATEDVLVYATAAQGFRVGGTNDNAINPGNVDVPVGFGPDELWSYELGWKTRLADNRITFNGAIYAIRWKDIQVGDFSPSSPFPFVQNAGKASIDGIEVEIQARPTDGLDIFFGGSYQDARLTEDFPSGEVLGLDGDKIPNVPKWQFGGSVQYSWPLANALEASVRGDITYRDDVNTLFRTNDPFNVHLDSYTLVDVQASVQSDRWRLTAYVKNLTDKLAQVDAINTSQDPLSYLTVRPRTIGLRASVNF
ncbi:MAG: TonB-dependent receptor [Alphaproteobacteria bacterium]|nr:MAG: TonB-dependent receptor [Alphaproteobacteria bacterium]